MGRRKVKSEKPVKTRDYSNLAVDDVLCPICRTIIIEPVSLPCNHGFCYVCFNDTMENANLVCPLCRLRVGSWYRMAKKQNRLIDELFWAAIKEQYHNEIQNKYSGIDNLIEQDKPIIIVSKTGEIRKEYEIQMYKQSEEWRKQKEAQEKASEDYIKNLKEKEEFHKIVEKTKLEEDAKLAMKLSKEISPGTSNFVTQKHKKSGPMDKFLKSEDIKNANVPSSFVTKEYTCRVLCLDKDNVSSRKSVPYSKTGMPVFEKKLEKKIQQIKKILESEEGSRKKDTDSGEASDIDSECKFYFKPIDSHRNPPTQGKTSLKIPSRKASPKRNGRILQPNGKIQFNPNVVKSAFARYSLTPINQNCTSIIEAQNCTVTSKSIKRKLSEEDTFPNRKKAASFVTTNPSSCREMSTRRHLRKTVESPPFLGFENTEKNTIESEVESPMPTVKVKVKVNGLNKEESAKKLLQEKADFEFAKRLQKELNSNSVSTRSRKKSKRQVTLDKMLMVK